MKRMFGRASLAFCAVFLFAGGVMAEGRKAVVIGNSAYPAVPLDNPRNDATLVAQTLVELDFDVALYLDVTSEQVPLLMERVREKLAGADIAVVYYAGHGLQYQDQNLLMPVDTDFSSVAGIANAGITLTSLLQAATASPGGIKVIILDACRNPLAATAAGGELRSGFSFVEAPGGEVLVAFSTAAGEVALDSTGGRNSPYTTALVNAFQQSGADLYDIFRTVRRMVRSGTGGQQIPWITGSIETSYVLRPAEETPGAATAPDPEAGMVTTLTGEVLSIDAVLWEYLRSSTDPEDYRRFLEVFPDSPFAEEARARQKFELAQAAGETVTRDGISLSPSEIVGELGADEPQPEDGARTSVLLDQSGSYVMRDSFRTWPLTLPETAAGLAAMATQCDEEAADPVDPMKLSPGISESTMNLRRALRACAFALAQEPENPRLLFQFGRILDLARRYDWANAYYDRAIDFGYGAAMVNRGFNARMGRGQKRDTDLAFVLYTRAAILGNPRARTNLGNAYLLGEGVDRNLTEGVLWLRLAASMGWPHAVNALGDVYMNGNGLDQNPVEAVALYRSAAEQGQTTAMANLGRAYLQGNGVAKDIAAGLDWLDRARGLGNGFAPVYAGRFWLQGDEGFPADPQRARALFEDGTRRGNSLGYLELARGYLTGTFGEIDLEEAFRNALFAESARVSAADKVIAQIETQLSAERQAAIRAEVKTFLEQNGL